MGGRVGAARSLAHVTPVRARLTTAAPGDAGALRSLASRGGGGSTRPPRGAGGGGGGDSPVRPGLRAALRGPGARAARAGASPAQVGSGPGRANFARIAPALGAQSLLPAGGVSGGGRVGRKWRENPGGGGLEHGGLAEPRVCAGTPGCQPSRLGRRPGSQRRGRGGKAGGNGPERRAFREEDSSRAPVARPGLRASRETPEERVRKSDPQARGSRVGLRNT
ncbi:unnamed protein product [Rangifer tarandus platyrhynchus]|uniref:Uncharacterized protein n=1 Tax=Rangifer tarandus platyrhynchus TaxID=3082113 RepID=A0AC59YFA8_RANTA